MTIAHQSGSNERMNCVQENTYNQQPKILLMLNNNLCMKIYLPSQQKYVREIITKLK